MKKKVAKKVCALALSAAMVLSMAACGGSSSTTETKAAETKAAETTVAQAAADTKAATEAAAADATENPGEGRKVADRMLLPSATIFQRGEDSCRSLC